MLYTLARWTWRITRWIWVTLIGAIVVSYIISILTTPATNIAKNFPQSTAGWLFLGTYSWLTYTIIILLAIITLAARWVIAQEGRAFESETLRKYLHTVVDANQGLNPKGLAQQSQALISVNVPLDEIFVHIRATSDRPVYDSPDEQQKILEETQQRDNISDEDREELIQRLRFAWQSEIGGTGAPNRQPKQNVVIEDVLAQLHMTNPAAIILGAPGSGKTTILRWLALHMARASLSRQHPLPKRMLPRQIPLLLKISDYAKGLSSDPTLTVEQFIKNFLATTYANWPELANKLLHELQAGHCLILFDGLDEVASNKLRRQVADNVFTFIANYSNDRPRPQAYNRVIITSRIVGYEANTFAKYAHYTLLDLEDEQIDQFLTNWCPAVERYQAMFAQSMKELTPQQKEQAARLGAEQRTRLMEILDKSPGIKRLAINPLMLTIMALIQRSGRTLPNRRVELYQLVTRTLLDTWNQETGRRMLPVEEIALAERVLGELAYRLHSLDPILIEQDVIAITRKVMTDFYQRPGGEASEKEARQFIETLRSSSGLFVESGQGLFNFMHRTFREYFVAQYLLRESQDELLQFTQQHYRDVIWREPILLVIAYKSARSSRDEQRQASDLISTIVESSTSEDIVLQRNLLFAAESATDCSAWIIDKTLQKNVANRLFSVYGDVDKTGRYTPLQQDIEKNMLMWLRGQPQASSQQNAFPPLLETWREALCEATEPVRQQGAVQLLARLLPEILDFPQAIFSALVPPLLQLVKLDTFAKPIWVEENLPEPPAVAASLVVEDYANLALRLLDKIGPAGWLYEKWIKWDEQQPQLLERLTEHAIELDYPLTPIALPSDSYSSSWETLLSIGNNWQQRSKRNPHELQLQLLNCSNTVRYPQAALLKRMLDVELTTPPANAPQQSWQLIWDALLHKEMARGNGATYQTSLSLRVLISRGNETLRQKVTQELMEELSAQGAAHVQALTLIANIYLQQPHSTLYLRYLCYLQYPRYISYLQQSGYLQYLKDIQYLRYLVYMRTPGAVDEFHEVLYERYLRYARNIQGIQNVQELQDMQEMQALQSWLDQKYITDTLCTLLKTRKELSYLVLLALYGILISQNNITELLHAQVKESIGTFVQRAEKLTIEQNFLINLITRLLNPPPPEETAATNPLSVASADKQAMTIYALKRQRHINRAQVQKLLEACANTYRLSEEKMESLGVLTVQEVAWKLLTQPFSIDPDATDIIVKALESDSPLVCAGAALLLQNCKVLATRTRQELAQEILQVLADDTRSRRPVNLPASLPITRLDDLLFETLRVLVV